MTGESKALNTSALKRWRKDPTRFIEEVLCDPNTGRPFQLMPWQKRFIEHAFKTDDAGRLVYPELLVATPKKTGKTEFAEMLLITTALVYGGPFAEAYCVANDLEQAQGCVFAAVRRVVEASPYLAREAQVTANRITFPSTGATIQALASDYASAAGANPTISCFDELWAYTSERSRRLWDEMVPVPTRKISCRLTTTYAGFSGESELLEELYKRGLAQPEVGPDLHAGNGLLAYWTHQPQAPWQTPAWVEQMRSQLRPNAFLRMIQNYFTSTEENFVEMAWWDACCTGRPVVADADLGVFLAVDASVKRDFTAITATTWDRAIKKVRLLNHRIFTPSPRNPINFEYDVESTILDFCRRYRVRAVLYDPWQMQASAQRLIKAGVRMEEFPQSMPNLTAAKSKFIRTHQGAKPHRLSRRRHSPRDQSRCCRRGARGWRISKEKTSTQGRCGREPRHVRSCLRSARRTRTDANRRLRAFAGEVKWLDDKPRMPPRFIRVDELGNELKTPEQAQAARHGWQQRRKATA